MIKLYYSAFRRTVRRLHRTQADVKYWKDRALFLEQKLEQRSDLFIEREFRLLDQCIASKGRYPITDQIKADKRTETDFKDAEWNNFRADKIAFLVDCLKQEDDPHPNERAASDFENNLTLYKEEFDRERIA